MRDGEKDTNKMSWGQVSEPRPPDTTTPWERSALDPPTVDPKVIPRNTFHKYKATCWEYRIQGIHFTEISHYKYCWVEPWKH